MTKRVHREMVQIEIKQKQSNSVQKLKTIYNSPMGEIDEDESVESSINYQNIL